jgi:hypothetical protein
LLFKSRLLKSELYDRIPILVCALRPYGWVKVSLILPLGENGVPQARPDGTLNDSIWDKSGGGKGTADELEKIRAGRNWERAW